MTKRNASKRNVSKAKTTRLDSNTHITTGNPKAPIGRHTTGMPSVDAPGRSTGRPRIKVPVPRFRDQKRDSYGRFV